MSWQALAVFLVAWVVPRAESQHLDAELPRWEKHPTEQRLLRDRERREAMLWSHRPPRSW